MSKKFATIILSGLISASPALASKSDQLFGVGSSTVYPFVTVVAEKFADKTGAKAPIIESTGTGGGMKLFCAGVGGNTPDFTNASREIKKSEIELCNKNGVTEIAEVKIGYDGIVLANSKKATRYKLTRDQLFLSLAREVVVNGKIVENPYQKWSDIDSKLPDAAIRVYGPPPTSGTRDAFVELVMEKSCKDLAEFKAAYPDKKLRQKKCGLIREDGAFVEAGENDNLIIQKLVSDKDSLGIFGYSYLESNSDKLQGAIVNNEKPTFENIASGKYPVSRSLFVYIKEQHYNVKDELKSFVKELVSEDTLGADGYLVYKGLIPLSEDELEEIREKTLSNF